MNKFFAFSALICLLVGCRTDATEADAYGNFEATTVAVSAEIGGKLLRNRAVEGERLAEGELVGLVDTTSLHLQRLQLRATLDALPRKLRSALAEIEVLREQKANLTRERDRVARLLEKEAATPQQLDELNGQIDVLERQMQAIRTQNETGNRAILSEREPLLAQIDVLDEQIRRARIYNPVAGTVLTRIAEAGEIVGPGFPLYRIGRLDTLSLRFYAEASQIQQLRVGQNIRVRIDSGTDEYQELSGRLRWIASEAEFTPTAIQTREDRVSLVYALKADVPNLDGTLKIGMPAEVMFSQEKKEP